jgi:hypothetical protein
MVIGDDYSIRPDYDSGPSESWELTGRLARIARKDDPDRGDNPANILSGLAVKLGARLRLIDPYAGLKRQ